MALDGVPWFIGVAGVEHSADVARALAYSATGGQDGIAAAGDFKVMPYSTPAGGVRIMPGSAAMVNRYQQNSKESYIGKKETVSYLPIRPTTSAGGRTDLVIATIRDPQQRTYSDWSESKKNDYEYFRFEVIEGVHAGAQHISNRDYPSIALARINIPASTGTITSSMITDLRRMTVTRTDRRQYIRTPGTDLNMAVSGYGEFPKGVGVTLEVPQWATRLSVVTHFSGLELTGPKATQSVAGFRGRFGGTQDLQNTIVKVDQGQRIQHTNAAQFAIPAAWRGMEVKFNVDARHVSGTGAIQADYQSTIIYDVEFAETPE